MAALMNIAHCYVWKFFYEAWGFDEFPVSKAYFDQLDSRHCIVKEPEEDLTTPSNPEGYKEPLGIGIVADDVLEHIKEYSL